MDDTCFLDSMVASAPFSGNLREKRSHSSPTPIPTWKGKANQPAVQRRRFRSLACAPQLPCLAALPRPRQEERHAVSLQSASHLTALTQQWRVHVRAAVQPGVGRGASAPEGTPDHTSPDPFVNLPRVTGGSTRHKMRVCGFADFPLCEKASSSFRLTRF